jgi:hypothetical protein
MPDKEQAGPDTSRHGPDNEQASSRAGDGGLAPISAAEREVLLDSHPVKEREYLLPTPMMERAYNVIRERVWARRTGAVFYASPRMGKTRCAIAIKDMLAEEFPHAYVSLLSARRAPRPNGSHMYRLILEAEQHVLSARANEDVLFENAKTDIRLKTKTKGGTQYVLLIDEVQLLNDTDLQQLVCFHNALELHKIRMTTISFAQPEILHRRTALMASNDRQIIARFLSEPLLFTGCASLAELARILRSYDIDSEFPENSEWSYTRFFVPEAFEAGLRLEQYAERIWKSLAREAGLANGAMLPMEHTCITIENLLLASRKHDDVDFVFSESAIDAAVSSSQIKSFNSIFETSEAE